MYDLKKTEYGKSSFVFEAKYDFDEWGQMDIVIDREKDIEYAERCIAHFESMPKAMRKELCNALIRYCEKYREFAIQEDFYFEIPEIQQLEEIFEYVSFSTIHVEDVQDTSIIAYSVDGSCDWEVEHGLQIVVRDDEILYVGNYEGVSIWDEKDNYIDEWNFA